MTNPEDQPFERIELPPLQFDGEDAACLAVLTGHAEHYLGEVASAQSAARALRQDPLDWEEALSESWDVRLGIEPTGQLYAHFLSEYRLDLGRWALDEWIGWSRPAFTASCERIANRMLSEISQITTNKADISAAAIAAQWLCGLYMTEAARQCRTQGSGALLSYLIENNP